jgi:peptidyl-prolyl cis-trans isomerase C
MIPARLPLAVMDGTSPSRNPRAALVRVLREPLTHFFLLGALLFLLHAALQEKSGPGAPAPRSRVVRLTGADLQTLRATHAASWKREPSAAELADLAASHLSEEILFREAASLGLDDGDEVVRRRLIEKMTVLSRPQAAAGEPSEAQLRAWYQAYRHRFRQPARLGFEQIFFDPKLRKDARAVATSALAGLVGRGPAEPAPAGLGDSFALPSRMSDRTDTQVAHLFGPAFAQALLAAPVGTWSGPVASNFGLHLVRVDRRDPERVPSFEEARRHVRADWITTETRGLRAAAESLLPRYRIELDAAAREALAGAPTPSPLLGRVKPP